ncbi:competence protein ComK [Anaerobacillus isosaccharinicus]|uniref:Competence protein ComK n=1 Tax=Anaerobacillus isosaccharinicus TaxID=1532552 RepID=A0A7S7L9X3_9BACI|nr:competence protein ComK [Anaerobacillus isosaccharinicus]MBA5584434.1 competence protein ComK [Anaerobacillus isosaccharinicus]QOY37178.1 competence protein ComK [Anaerobacillus isosaccharinicus]
MMAIVPYGLSIAIESDRFYIIKQLLQLIKLASLKGGSSNDGRPKAVGYQLVIRHKVAISIRSFEQTYAFPTHSPTQFNFNYPVDRDVLLPPCPLFSKEDGFFKKTTDQESGKRKFYQ